MLNIQKMIENGKETIVLEGMLDTNTAPDLEKELGDVPESVTELTFDLEKLEYISSSGLRILLSAQKTMNRQGRMKVIHVCGTVMEIFEITGLADVLTIE